MGDYDDIELDPEVREKLLRLGELERRLYGEILTGRDRITVEDIASQGLCGSYLKLKDANLVASRPTPKGNHVVNVVYTL